MKSLLVILMATDAVDAWGGYQGILIDSKTGVLMGGSGTRKDGLAIGW